MRIVVISDSHKNTRVIDKILNSQPDAKYVFFLGDNITDIEDFEFMYPDKRFFAVSGNCDYFSTAPSVGVQTVSGVKILYTHGHNFGVKYGVERLKEAARQSNCQIALYGHTHISQSLYEDGLHIVNPGSCSQPRDGITPTYAVIDITEKGIMPVIIKL